MKRTIPLLLALGAVSALGGCESLSMDSSDGAAYRALPDEAAETPPTPPAYRSEPILASDHAERKPNAVKEALGWARKYMDQAEKTEQVRRELQRIQAQLSERDRQNAQLRTELAQARKDLDDANAMMMELKGELKEWKTSVLGYRREVLDALEAQLRGTNTILKFLGYQAPESGGSRKTAARTGK